MVAVRQANMRYSPLISQMVAVTAIHGPMPLAMARNPNTSTGTVLANRCAQLTCSNGAQMIPMRPDSDRA